MALTTCLGSLQILGVFTWQVEEDIAMTRSENGGPPRRLVQTFLYQRVDGDNLEDNHYAHPIDILPVVDLNTQTVVRIDGLDREPAPADSSRECQLSSRFAKDKLLS